MLNINNLLLKFGKISYLDKRKKLISILEILKEDKEGNSYRYVHNLLQSGKKLKEDFLIEIYTILIEAMGKVQSKIVDNSIENFNIIREKMEDHILKEEKEKKEDEKKLNNILQNM